MNVFPPGGLYAITPSCYPDDQRLLDDCTAALRGGARLLQFRDKSGDRTWRLEVGKRLLDACRQHQVPLIINDDIELALQLGAAGVHLGQEDVTIAEARSVLPAGSIIGATCHNRLDLARSVAEQGATYLAFGSMFPSATKPGAVSCPPQILIAAQSLGLPLVAIGGITLENGRLLIESGADYLAVIDALFAQGDVRGTAAKFASLWLFERGQSTFPVSAPPVSVTD